MLHRGAQATYDRVLERRRAVALAHHYREAEGLSIAQIADRLGRSPATIKAYFYDPTGEKARAVKARYVGVCRGCGAYTQPRNGKGDAYAYCKACHPGAISDGGLARRVGRDARVARSLRQAAVVLRLVTHPRTTPWGRAARASRRRTMAGGERSHEPVRKLGGRTHGGCVARGGAVTSVCLGSEPRRRAPLKQVADAWMQRRVLLCDLRPASRRYQSSLRSQAIRTRRKTRLKPGSRVSSK